MCFVSWISQSGGAECSRALGGAFRSALGGAFRRALGGASVAPSVAAASPDPFAAFRDETLKPPVDQMTTAFPQFSDAFTAATAADATDIQKIAFGTAAFKLRVALQRGLRLSPRRFTDLPECGVEAQTQAQGFFTKLTEDSQDLLAETTANPDQADAVTELVEQAATSATELTTAIDQACT